MLATMIGIAHAQTGLEGGVWVAKKATNGGETVAKVIGHRLVFDGDRFQITMDGELLYGGGFSVDENMKPPTIRFDQSDTETLAGIWLGIYELDGDTVTICDNAPDMEKPQPRTFDDCRQSGYVVIEFAR